MVIMTVTYIQIIVMAIIYQNGQRLQTMFYLLAFLVLAHNLVRTSFSELNPSSPKPRSPKLIEHSAGASVTLCQI